MKKSEFDARVELSRLNLEKRRLDLEERKLSEVPRRADVSPGTAADGLAELLRGHPGAKGERGEQGPAGIPGIDGQHGERGADGRDGTHGARGEDGADGLDGRDGAPGPQGPVGPQGPKGDPGVPGIVWRGNYQSGTEYAPGDAVAFEGSSWVTRSKTTARPTPGEWDLLAKKGDGGAVGGARPMSFGPTVASAISVAPSGALSSTNVQAALVEVQGDVDLLVANAHDPVSVSGPAGWLSLVGQALTFALVAASDTVAGVVSTAAQTFAGVKTFASEVAASAGVLTTFVRAAGASLVLRSSLGAAAADKCVVVGTSEVDGTVHADAKVWVAATGIGGTQIDKVFATKKLLNAFGLVVDEFGHISVPGGGSGATKLYVPTGNSAQVAISAQGADAATLYMTTQDGVGVTSRRHASGIDSIAGTDSSAAPGAATINKPSGKSAIAGGATTVTITNNLVALGDQVHVTWHGDLGTQSKIPFVTTAAGSFTVTVGTAPAGAVAFCWTLSKRI